MYKLWYPLDLLHGRGSRRVRGDAGTTRELERTCKLLRTLTLGTCCAVTSPRLTAWTRTLARARMYGSVTSPGLARRAAGFHAMDLR